MKTIKLLLSLVPLLLCGGLISAAPIGSAFHYNGLLHDNGAPANGSFDLKFRLFDVPSAGSPVALDQILNDVAVNNGLFTVTLDFGVAVFDGNARFLEIHVRPGASTGNYNTLSQRQPVLPTPEAVHAAKADTANSVANAAITSAQLANNTVVRSLNGLRDAVSLVAGANVTLTPIGNSLQISATPSLASDHLSAPDGSPANAVQVDNDGHVGIGSVGPVRGRLSIGSFPGTAYGISTRTDSQGRGIEILTEDFVYGSSGSALSILLGAGSGNAVTKIQADINGKNTAGNLVLQSFGGNVGIGTASPIYPLDVASTSQAVARFTTLDHLWGSVLELRNISTSPTHLGAVNFTDTTGFTEGQIAYRRDGHMTFNVGRTERMRIKSDGGLVAGLASTTSGLAAVSLGSANANNGDYSTITGGWNNTIAAEANRSAIGGGSFNYIRGPVSHGTIVGGHSGYIGPNADLSTVLGGAHNSVTAPGGLAAGYRAQVVHQGAFVWGDTTEQDISSFGNNTFAVRATGGVRIYSSTTAGVRLNPGSTAWSSLSDRASKKNFAPVNCREILDKLTQVPLSHWNYHWEVDGDTPHLGPAAQDFKAEFYPGRDDKSITTLEYDGVALAAIQGLNQKLEEQLKVQDVAIQKLQQAVAELKSLLTNSKP